MKLGTYIDVNADAFISGQDPRGLVASFFRYPERIRISEIRVLASRSAFEPQKQAQEGATGVNVTRKD